MRLVLAAAAALVLISAAQSSGPPRTPEAQAKLDKYLEGRVAGEVRKCIKTEAVTYPIAIDDRTLLFRDGPRIWRNDLKASLFCGKIGKQAFIHTESAAGRVCNGEQLEFSDGGIEGACVFGDFVPYRRVG